jgi:hypothetical protein
MMAASGTVPAARADPQIRPIVAGINRQSCKAVQMLHHMKSISYFSWYLLNIQCTEKYFKQNFQNSLLMTNLTHLFIYLFITPLYML